MRRKRKKHRLLSITCFLFSVLLVTTLVTNQLPQKLINAISNQELEGGRQKQTLELLDGLQSSNATLVQLDNDTPIESKDGDHRVYPASLTKIMTLLVALEEINDFQATTKIAPYTIEYIQKMNASVAGFQAHEEVRVLDLLYGLQLASGAECALTISEYVAGTEEHFVDKMNAKAKKLQLENTHFTNCTGLDDPNQYTSANDIAKLLRYALNNQDFRFIFTSYVYQSTPSDAHPKGILISSTLSQKLQDMQIGNETILGGKTGTTDNAGLCLASLLRVKNQEYVLVTLGAPYTNDDTYGNVMDAISVVNRL
ncbi:D-alanyl-D-alanine carboxypeptidase (penicillin-binding protein 5/6) [Breznakia blatticola]|uniref:D-alanyl-D-alanine carboxypeptidase (Penicillin-binding protein 5/6) n=1 Tax=Breznakia blatticola TaxID=1754012 RepID=A0A4R7ZB05_9FIRM|nr:serine hydrolase [Breznakia blatticola]TDW14663.1 D-alanyl-D-alanine carboxypeptidase (penicillin-binding protein 5/6) [Breznakia blatticola]